MKILSDYFSDCAEVKKEYQDTVLKKEGEIPAFLKGTLFRNGNGNFQHMGVKYQHLFDGDGMVLKFEISDGEIRYSNRYVRTREFEEEKKKQKFLYRGFGTNKPGGFFKNFLDMRFKNTANTSVIYHGGKLLALWEGGLPHELDPVNLDTLGRFDYEGSLRNNFSWLDQQIFPELPFSAHPKVHPETGELHNFGTAPGMKNRLIHYRVSTEGNALIFAVTEMERLFFTHDFLLLDDRSHIYLLTPVNFNILSSFFGFTSPVGSMQADKSKPITILWVSPEGEERRFKAPFGFSFHLINGYQDGDHLIIDALQMEDWPDAESMKKLLLESDESQVMQPKPVRFKIDLRTDEVQVTKLVDYEMEFPSIFESEQGRPYGKAWGIVNPEDGSAGPFFQGIGALDTQEGKMDFHHMGNILPGEPVRVPGNSPAEDLLLMTLYNGDTRSSELHGYRCEDLSLVFRAHLPHNIPLGFHGRWYPQLFE